MTFDYSSQTWLNGPKATKTERAQLLRERAIVVGANGWKYLRFIGENEDIEIVLNRIDHQLSELDKEN